MAENWALVMPNAWAGANELLVVEELDGGAAGVAGVAATELSAGVLDARLPL